MVTPVDRLAIECVGLTRTRPADSGAGAGLDHVDLGVEPGEVHVLLGGDGSGKSTLLRVLMGLARARSGTAHILGEPVPSRLPAVIDRVGAMVDGPAFSSTFRVRLNLELLAGAAGVERARVDEVLEKTGLTSRARRRYRTLSPAAKQRLGIAAALLRGPEVLVLDEPTSRLDAEGTETVRTLLGEEAARGATVLLTSHDPVEARAIGDRVTVMSAGRALVSGPVEDLLGEGRVRTRVGVSDPAAGAAALRHAGYTVLEPTRPDGPPVLVVEGHEHPEEIARVLSESGLWVTELSAVQPDLASVVARHDSPTPAHGLEEVGRS